MILVSSVRKKTFENIVNLVQRESKKISSRSTIHVEIFKCKMQKTFIVISFKTLKKESDNEWTRQ